MITQKYIVKFRLKNPLRMSFFKRNRNKVKPSEVTLLKSQDTKQRLEMTLNSRPVLLHHRTSLISEAGHDGREYKW